MSLKFYSNIEKLNADDVRVYQQSGDVDGVIAAYYDLNGSPSLFMSGASATLGYVGVKTDNPNEALTVVGNISATGKLFASDMHVPVSVNNQTTSLTIALSDVDSILVIDSSSPTTVTVPANSTIPFDIGSRIDIIQLGVGQITISSTNGNTIHSSTGYIKTANQYSVVELRKIDSNVWIMSGDLSKN